MHLPALFLASALVILPAVTHAADPYLDSAHGSVDKGVLRPEKAKSGYARANCSHCHETHGGSVISDSGTGQEKAFPYSLYALNYDSRTRTGVYTEPVSICFSCHNSTGSAQRVQNEDVSKGQGCSTLQGPRDILAAFNQASRHNLYDLWKYLNTEKESYPWVTEATNPCSACHNPHLARNRKGHPQDTAYSSLSMPSNHRDLWSRSMKTAYSLQYEPPYCSSQNNREPAGAQVADQARNGMIDFVSFCTECHNSKKTISSSSLERNLIQINWSKSGDIHGESRGSGTTALKKPYQANSQQNYVLSCLDCHESHGAANTALLRNWVNGDDLLGKITTSINILPGTGDDTQNIEMGYLCLRCHEPDEDTGTDAKTPPRWEMIHHGTPESPYSPSNCEGCHTMEGGGTTAVPLPIDCVNCHFHGGNDGWLKELSVKHDTF